MAAAGFASRILQVGSLAYLLLFATFSVSPSLGGPIRLRENLWATGHFMGKKSMLSSPHVQSAFSESSETNSTPKAFREGMKDLVMSELLKMLLQEKLLEENRGKRDPNDQEIPFFTKYLAKYI
ncbi:neuromedin-B [Podarcis muralis]|uniref:Neuromedin-B-like n=1 Tax=Podarcis muralis TaxID=64176 RepID=A0A670JDJ5_PODMU|nr:neuromedin-B-like [Podarcis muralis]